MLLQDDVGLIMAGAGVIFWAWLGVVRMLKYVNDEIEFLMGRNPGK